MQQLLKKRQDTLQPQAREINAQLAELKKSRQDTLEDTVLRALNQFNAEDSAAYLALMKATIGDVLGLNGGFDEVDLLERKIETRNRKMLELVNESVQGRTDIESPEDEFKELSDTIEQPKSRIQTLQEGENPDGTSDRIVQIQ